MWLIDQNCKQNLYFASKQMCRYLLQNMTIYNKAHSRKTQCPARAKKHWKYSEIPSTWTHTCFWKGVGGESKENYSNYWLSDNRKECCHEQWHTFERWVRKGRGKYSKSTFQAESSIDVVFPLANEQWRTRIPASPGPFWGSEQQDQSTQPVCFSSFACILSRYLLHYCFVSRKEGEHLV